MYHLIDYVWCVEKFSQYFEPHDQEVYPLLTSPIFAYKNTRWVLNLYPEGLGDSASHGYISLFIKYVSEDPETINAKVELSLLNNKNERVYCRDTGDHQYQTFIDFGYKQFLKIQDIKEQKDELISFNGLLKIFARVEFEHATLPTSLTWSNYDLLLFKENFKDLYETKNLCDIIVKVVKTSPNTLSNQQQQPQQQLAVLSVSSSSSSLSMNRRYTSHPYLSSSSSVALSTSTGGSNSLMSTNYVPKLKKQLYHHQHQQHISECSDCSSHHQPYLFENNSESKLTLFSSNYSSQSSTPFVKPEQLEIKSHKFILASRSGKFRELLKTNLIKLVSSSSLPSSDLITSNNYYCNKCLKRLVIPASTATSTSAGGLVSSVLVNDTSQNQESASTASSSCSASSSSSSSSSSSCSSSSTTVQILNTFHTNQQLIDYFELNCTCHDEKSRVKLLNEDESITDMLIIETDRNPKVIEYLIRYMYTGYLDSLDMFAKDIYEISKEYKVHGLTNLAREHIIKELNIQSCCDYLVFCVVNNDYELNNKIQAFIAENYETIVKTNAYKQAKRKYRELFENTFNEIFKKIPAFNLR